MKQLLFAALAAFAFSATAQTPLRVPMSAAAAAQRHAEELALENRGDWYEKARDAGETIPPLPRVPGAPTTPALPRWY